jgi:hypothetical protein
LDWAFYGDSNFQAGFASSCNVVLNVGEKGNATSIYFNDVLMTSGWTYSSAAKTISVAITGAGSMQINWAPSVIVDPLTTVVGVSIVGGITGAVVAWYYRRKTKSRTVVID